MSRREVILRNALSSALLDLGYNVFIPVFDEGVDLIAHREKDGDIKVIQQKSRWTIDRKYMGRDIWIAFPDDTTWYLVPHDDMLDWPEVEGFLQTRSWQDKGIYHMARPSRALKARVEPFALTKAASIHQAG